MDAADATVTTDALTALLARLPLGLVRRTRGRTVAAAELSLFQQLTGTSAEPGACSALLALMSGLRDAGSIPHGLMESHHFDVVAALAAAAEFESPLQDGDTICVETRLTAARPSRSQAGRGVMEVEERCLNQRAEVLVRRTRAFLIEPAPPAPAEP